MDQPHCRLVLSSMENVFQECQVVHHLMNSYSNYLKVQIIKYQSIRQEPAKVNSEGFELDP